jgi:14-3-3 protein epsilon
MTSDRDVKVQIIQLLDQTDLSQDMVDLVKDVIAADPILDQTQRDLLSISYKNAITPRRTAIRYLTALLDQQEDKLNPYRTEQVTALREKIIAELDSRCLELIGLIDEKLLPAAVSAVERLFYLKLRADYWRYISENKEGPEKERTAVQAQETYEKAISGALPDVPPYEATYLGLILNYSVYLYEIVGKKEEAIALAQKTQAEASLQIASNSKDAYKQAASIIQLLQDNLALWIKAR